MAGKLSAVVIDGRKAPRLPARSFGVVEPKFVGGVVVVSVAALVDYRPAPIR